MANRMRRILVAVVICGMDPAPDEVPIGAEPGAPKVIRIEGFAVRQLAQHALADQVKHHQSIAKEKMLLVS